MTFANVDKEFDGSFFDADYFERGPESGKGWLENYRWLPRRTFKEAFAFIDYLGLDDESFVLEVGCAKGYLIRALRALNIQAEGCDISSYALSFAPSHCYSCEGNWFWEESKGMYTHIVIKDVLEHLNVTQLKKMLKNISMVAKKMMVVVPLGDDGVYRIPEYHTEISHLIAEDENWWKKTFEENGWIVEKGSYHVSGLKDNWFTVNPKGNYVFVLNFTRKGVEK